MSLGDALLGLVICSIMALSSFLIFDPYIHLDHKKHYPGPHI